MKLYTATFIDFSESEMRKHAEKVRKWASSDEKPLLKQLAQEVIDAAGT